MKNDVINCTSFDDIKSSLHFHTTKASLPYLKRSLAFELKHLNRISVIRLLESRIKKLEKL